MLLIEKEKVDIRVNEHNIHLLSALLSVWNSTTYKGENGNMKGENGGDHTASLLTFRGRQ